MKKFISLFSCLFICFNTFFIGSTFALANSSSAEFLRVINNETIFYTDKDCNYPLFYLPYTYYVKVLYDFGDIVKVECYSDSITTIDGYCYKNQLFYDNLDVNYPYLEQFVITNTTTTLYLDCSLKNAICYVFSGRSAGLYGEFLSDDNQTIYLIDYDGKMGYVKRCDVYEFTFPEHPNPKTFIKDSFNENFSDESNTAFILRIVIISCLILAGLTALFVKKTPKRTPREQVHYYDENDYE